MKFLCIPFILLSFCYSACRDKFEPDLPAQQQSFLVVEGNLNAGSDSTVVRLTRTFALDNNAILKPENNAILTVEGEDNTSRTLAATGNGYYTTRNLNLLFNTKYRLRIRTSNGKEYLSEYVKARPTPPIDSINTEEIDREVKIYANTHDPSGSSRYYRWDYEETWEIHSDFRAFYIYVHPNVRPRNYPSEDVYFCWKYGASTNILLANSVNLQDDVIYRMPLLRIPIADEKVAIRYSIRVRQYAIDKAAYDFFEIMKKNTEQIGSIFSPQPSELRGNIHSTSDPDEYVIGYVTASEEQRERIFVMASQSDFRLNCSIKEVTLDSTAHYFQGMGYMPFEFERGIWLSSTPLCVDCRVRGGSIIKPSYW